MKPMTPFQCKLIETRISAFEARSTDWRLAMQLWRVWFANNAFFELFIEERPNPDTIPDGLRIVALKPNQGA